MAVKIELERNEILDVILALDNLANERRRAADTGRISGRKISSKIGMDFRQQQKRLEKLADFFNSILKR